MWGETGIALSKICRLENEHKTVLDLWEPARIVRHSSEEFRTPLENAILKSDLKQVNQLIKGGMVFINEKDTSGSTALHLSCSYIYNEHRLDITEFLLSQPDIDVSIINNNGNSALHYFARIPVTEEIRAKYRCVLLKFLANENLFQQNFKVFFFNLIFSIIFNLIFIFLQFFIFLSIE